MYSPRSTRGDYAEKQPFNIFIILEFTFGENDRKLQLVTFKIYILIILSPTCISSGLIVKCLMIKLYPQKLPSLIRRPASILTQSDFNFSQTIRIQCFLPSITVKAMK
jgi:hypothetical protein